MGQATGLGNWWFRGLARSNGLAGISPSLGKSPSIPQRLARGPLRTRDQLYFPISVLVYLATPASTLCSRGCHWEDGPAKTSTLQPLHRNGVLWGNLGLWDPCSHLLVSLANTSTALQSLVGCLPAFSTLSPFSSQVTTASSGPVVSLPPASGRRAGLEDYQGLILTIYPAWPSGLVVVAVLRFVMLGWGEYLRLFWGLVWPCCAHNLQRWKWLPEGSAGGPVTLLEAG